MLEEDEVHFGFSSQWQHEDARIADPYSVLEDDEVNSGLSSQWQHQSFEDTSVADPYRMLEEDEVHFGFSGQWQHQSFEDTHKPIRPCIHQRKILPLDIHISEASIANVKAVFGC